MAVLKIIHGQNAESLSTHDNPKYHDENSLYNVIAYCCNPAKAKSGLIGGFGIDPPYAAEQMDALARAYRKADGIRLRHMVLSFNAANNAEKRIRPDMAFYIAYQAAWYYGQTYQILFAVHEDKPHRHVHFVMNTVSFQDGHKYAGKKEDYYSFQRYLQRILADYGIHFDGVL